MKSSATPATPKPSQDPRALRVVGGGRGARGEGGDYQDWRGGAGETMGATEMGVLWRRDAYKYARVCSEKKTKAKFVRCSRMGKLCPPMQLHRQNCRGGMLNLCIYLKHTHAVGCRKLMALDEEFPICFLDGEAPFFMKVSILGCHKKVLIGLWGHAQLF